MMKDLRLKLQNNNDLDLSTGDLQFVDGIEYYRQKVSIVLRFFYGEWFLDTTKGIKYFDDVFVKNANFTLVNNLFKIALLEIEGITEITKFDSSFKRIERIYSLDFVVQTNVGELAIQTEVGI